jgi:hypothetical protein
MKTMIDSTLQPAQTHRIQSVWMRACHRGGLVGLKF